MVEHKLLRSLLVMVIGIILFSNLASAINDLWAIEGRATEDGQRANGNISIEIWTAPTGGTLFYNETLINAISDGFFHITLGNSSGGQELNATFGQIMYIDLIINGNDLDFQDGQERQIFQFSIGDINESNGLNITGDLEISGNVTADTFFGSGNFLNITVNGTFTGNIPANNVTSGTFQGGDYTFPANLTVTNNLSAGYMILSNNLDIGGDASVTGNITVTGNVSSDYISITNNLDVGGDTIIHGDLTVLGDVLNATVTNQYLNGSFLPQRNKTFDLGSTAFFWSNLYADTVNVTSLKATSLYGDGSNLWGVSDAYFSAWGFDWQNMTSVPTVLSNFTDDIGYLQNASIASFDNVTITGNLTINGELDVSNINLDGTNMNLGGGNISTTGNISAAYFIGDGSGLIRVTDHYFTAWAFGYPNITGSPTVLSNFTDDVGYLQNGSVASFDNVTITGNLTVDGELDVSNINLDGTNMDLGGGNISTTGNISAAYFIGDGSGLIRVTDHYFTAWAFGYPNITGAPTLLSNFTNDKFFVNENVTGDFNVSGNITAQNLTVKDDVTINGGLSVGENITVTGNVSANNFMGDFMVGYLGTSTNTTLQDMIDTTQSAGKISGGVFTDNGDGTITVSAGTGYIKTTDDELGRTLFFDWGANTSVPFTDSDTNYLYIDYNSGDPIVKVTLSRGTIHFTDQIGLGRVYREGTTLHLLTGGVQVQDLPYRVHRRLNSVDGFVRATGLQTSETGILNVAITAGIYWAGLTEFNPSDYDSSTTNFTYWHNNGTWQSHSNNTIDNQSYNDYGSEPGIVALTANNYGVHWVYMNYDGAVNIVYGQGSYKLAEARDVNRPDSLPDIINDFSILLAKIIIFKGEVTTFTDIDTPWESIIPSGTVTDHGSLAGLADDDHTIYLLADGTRDLSGDLTVTGNMTATGNISADSLILSGALDVQSINLDGTNMDLGGGNISTTGNISAAYFIGDGSGLIRVTDHYFTAWSFGYPNITGSPTVLSNFTDDVGYLQNGSVASFDNITITGNLTVDGELDVSSINLDGTNMNLGGGNISTIGNISAAYFIGDGSGLSGLVTAETDPYFVAWGFDWQNMTAVPTFLSNFTDDVGYLQNSTDVTLAAVTMSGDLTIDSTTFTVDTSNDRVGIDTASIVGSRLAVGNAANGVQWKGFESNIVLKDSESLGFSGMGIDASSIGSSWIGIYTGALGFYTHNGTGDINISGTTDRPMYIPLDATVVGFNAWLNVTENITVAGNISTDHLQVTTNITTPALVLSVDTGNHYIYDNATCVIIKGDTSTLTIC